LKHRGLYLKFMKRYGKQNDAYDDGDKLSNCNNAVKSSINRLDGKGALRSSTQKHRYRTIMNKRKRAELKELLLKEMLCMILD
jgi:hypothetical protein